MELLVCKSLKCILLLFQYYAECHAVIYVVDSADRERMGESKDVFGKLVYHDYFFLVIN